jgi:hypothetical protein
MFTRRVIGLFLLLSAAGCTSMAVRPPSPARDLPAEELLAGGLPNERYYVIMFGAQNVIRIPRFTHSWLTMVRVTQSSESDQPVIDEQTISWMPASLVIRPYSLSTEPGVNLGLHETIGEVRKHHERISMWGPYEIWHGSWKRLVTQKAFLESGALGYQCNDSFGEAARRGNGCNCFHAITDVDPVYDRRQYPLFFFGDAASRNIVRQIAQRPILIHPEQTHDWLIPALGLDCYPIVRRQYRGPTRDFSLEAYLETINNPPPPRRRLLP